MLLSFENAKPSQWTKTDRGQGLQHLIEGIFYLKENTAPSERMLISSNVGIQEGWTGSSSWEEHGVVSYVRVRNIFFTGVPEQIDIDTHVVWLNKVYFTGL